MANALNRLLWWHILLIGVGASLILFLILYFAMIKPKSEQVDSVLTTAKSTEDAGGTPQAVTTKTNELKKAQQDTVRINQQWQIQSAAYMPPIDFTKDPLPVYENVSNQGVYHANGKSYGVKDLPAVWGRWVTAWYLSQWRDGIVPLTGFPVESFSADPNDVSKLQAISFPLTKPWEVEVSAKNFDAAINHLRRFNHMQQHGMPVIDKVALNGQSPDLRVKYNLQIYVIPPTAPPAADPAISGAGTGGGGAPGGPSSFPGGGSSYGGPGAAGTFGGRPGGAGGGRATD
jgi:uncharacterized membrane protein YgcG